MNKKLRELAEQIGIQHKPGSTTKPGKLYHDIPFDKFSTHREGTEKRAQLILDNYSVSNKAGLDLGCSVGGMSFYLTLAGATMTGVDYDPAVIEFAKAAASEYNCPVDFKRKSITAHLIKEMPKYDFIIWLDQWMWIVKDQGWKAATELLKQVSRKAPIMFFSTSQNDGQAKNQIKSANDGSALLKQHTIYTNIQNLGVVDDNWHKRSTFICSR